MTQFPPFLWLLSHSFIFIFLAALFVGAVILKGFALWRAGRNNHPVWFIVLLLVNTFGILELAYLLHFSKKDREGTVV